MVNPHRQGADDSEVGSRSIQKFLVHAVTEAAEQAIGPRHALLQILAGDGIIRIPLLYLTVCGLGERSPALGRQRASDEHLHESRGFHKTRSCKH